MVFQVYISQIPPPVIFETGNKQHHRGKKFEICRRWKNVCSWNYFWGNLGDAKEGGRAGYGLDRVGSG